MRDLSRDVVLLILRHLNAGNRRRRYDAARAELLRTYRNRREECFAYIDVHPRLSYQICRTDGRWSLQAMRLNAGRCVYWRWTRWEEPGKEPRETVKVYSFLQL